MVRLPVIERLIPIPMKRVFVLSACAAMLAVSCSSQKNDPSPEELLSQYGSKFSENFEVRQCLNRSVNVCVSDAISREAVEKRDETVCSQLSDFELRDSCQKTVATHYAKVSENSDPCAKLSGSDAVECAYEGAYSKARTAKNAEFCSSIRSAASGTNDKSVRKLAEAAVRNCQESILIEFATTASQCAVISDAMTRKKCESSVITRMR